VRTDATYSVAQPHYIAASARNNSTVIPEEKTMNCKKCGTVIDGNGACQQCLTGFNSKSESLWNPNAIANWSLLLTPIFGAWLTAKNWQALGQDAYAQKSRKWMLGMAAGLPLATVLMNMTSLPSFVFPAVLGSFVAIFLLWFFMENRKQNSYIKMRFSNGYTKQSWLRPLVRGAVALIIWQIAVWLIWDGPSGAPRCDQVDVQNQTLKLVTQILSNEFLHQYVPNVTYDNAKKIATESVQNPDEQVVKKMMTEYVGKVDEQIGRLKMSLTAIRPITADDKIRLSTCAASVSLSNGNTFNLTYSVQKTTDGQIYVEVQIH
jgi:hypothetical protein